MQRFHVVTSGPVVGPKVSLGIAAIYPGTPEGERAAMEACKALQAAGPDVMAMVENMSLDVLLETAFRYRVAQARDTMRGLGLLA